MKKLLLVTLGALLMAIGLNGFLAPHNLVIGGFSGIALILLRLFNIPMWLTTLLLNIPLLLIALKIKGKAFTLHTLYSTFMLSFFIGVTEMLPYFETDILLGCVFGGIVSGAGLGLVFKGESTTGGSDLLAGLIVHFFPYMSITRVMLILDVIVILAGYFTLGAIAMFYAVIAVYIISKVIDIVLEGLDFAKAAFIISSNADIMGDEITRGLHRGATLFNGTGIYSKTPKNMVIVVISSKQIAKLKAITKEVDPKSFVFISDVREIMGDFRK